MCKRVSVATIVIFAITITMFSFENLADTAAAPNHKVSINKNGETYGSLSDVDIASEELDLIAARGVDGTLGYIRFKDFNGGDMPKSPREAIERNELANEPRCISLYGSDGETVLGVFEISKSEQSSFSKENIEEEEYQEILNR